MGRFGDWQQGPQQLPRWCIHYRVERRPWRTITMFAPTKERAIERLKGRLGHASHGLPVFEIAKVHEPGKTPGGMFVPAGIDACDLR